MKASEIIQRAATQVGIDPAVAIKVSADTVRQNHMKLLQHNNSLMYYNIMGAVAHVHIVTADSQLNMMSSLMYFMRFLATHGVHTAYMNTENPQVLQSLKMVGIEPEGSDDPKYKVMVRL